MSKFLSKLKDKRIALLGILGKKSVRDLRIMTKMQVYLLA